MGWEIGMSVDDGPSEASCDWDAMGVAPVELSEGLCVADMVYLSSRWCVAVAIDE